MKFGIITFPGSNCDDDTYRAVSDVLGAEAVRIWHKDHDVQGADVLVLPGGFSYGDYLRAGAIARFSPVMREVIEHARRGAPVLGICNGFQILCEAGLLPGVLLRNASLTFASEWVTLRVENADTLFTNQYAQGQLLRMPIAHGDGRFTMEPAELARLEDNAQIVFRYVDAEGNPTPGGNPNGAMNSVAGLINAQGNVLGIMPHPERAVETVLGSSDGLGLFESILSRVAA